VERLSSGGYAFGSGITFFGQNGHSSYPFCGRLCCREQKAEAMEGGGIRTLDSLLGKDALFHSGFSLFSHVARYIHLVRPHSVMQ
jgi:hypothetical protein